MDEVGKCKFWVGKQNQLKKTDDKNKESQNIHLS